MMNTSRIHAFTLVELAIIMTILGLIIGGVLAGQDLIRAATIRAEVGDLEKYNAGATSFRAKFQGLPGDLSVTRAIEYKFSANGDTNATGAPGYRDGNDAIEGGASGSTRLVGETGLFWQDLGTAGFIGGTYTGTGSTNTTGINLTQSTVGNFLPKSRFRENVTHLLYALNGRNYYYLAAYTTDASANMAAVAAMTPLESKGLDEKMDDGMPTSGTVVSMTDFSTPAPGAAAASTVCNTNVTPSVYNVGTGATGAADSQVCQMRIRSSF